jgi:hypothetical protein
VGVVMVALRALVVVACCCMICVPAFAVGCPPGYVASSNNRSTGESTCIKSIEIDCGGGIHCPAGTTCARGGTCAGGPKPTGPLCGPVGARCPAGARCNRATGSCYDPRTQYRCGVVICGLDFHYTGNNSCVPCQARHRASRH